MEQYVIENPLLPRLHGTDVDGVSQIEAEHNETSINCSQ
jgi:hypothetical protein